MAEHLTALVIGGGIAGMSAAIALRRAGLAVDLIDRDPHWRVYGAGITITGSTLCPMGKLGILDEVLRQGYAAHGIDIRSADGKPMFSIETQNEALGDIPAQAGSCAKPWTGSCRRRFLPSSPACNWVSP
ncbi:MAG: FAD-dependent monooxygenase [Ensifer alkalisoli]|nr:FAD-dependent monooxygenase [Sinorhizobium alkalisoli]